VFFHQKWYTFIIMKDISRILRALGLLDSEVRTYLAALEKGPQTVADLSKAAGLSRQATYVAIDALIERGLMSHVLHGKKRFFMAEHPSKLLAYAKRHRAEVDEQVDDLERALPELELQTGGERPIVKVFEGKEGMQTVMEELVRSNAYEGNIDEITDLDTMYATLDLKDLKPYRDKAAKKRIRVRSLQSGTPLRPPVGSVKRITLPKEFSNFKTSLAVYEQYIYLVTFEGKIHSILIESPALARTIRILYDLAFQRAEERFHKKQPPRR
jgi:sugar-specific transcriptional regulator TrmB